MKCSLFSQIRLMEEEQKNKAKSGAKNQGNSKKSMNKKPAPKKSTAQVAATQTAAATMKPTTPAKKPTYATVAAAAAPKKVGFAQLPEKVTVAPPATATATKPRTSVRTTNIEATVPKRAIFAPTRGPPAAIEPRQGAATASKKRSASNVQIRIN